VFHGKKWQFEKMLRIFIHVWKSSYHSRKGSIMRKIIPLCIVCLLSMNFGAAAAYDSLTAAQLHQRLLDKDTLLILDVREFTTSEYLGNHIAEPAGQLPLTPACMPWNSGVLQANYSRLPKNIDIIVQCSSGGRSKKASAFLDSLGFTRIFNMLGGFSAWTFEKRSGYFGDHTGAWMNASFTKHDTVTHDSASIIGYPAAFAGLDSVYCEVHFASGKQPAPADAPVSDAAGLFRVTTLDKFGIPLFTGDSIPLTDTVGLTFIPHVKHHNLMSLTALTGNGVWSPLESDYSAPATHRSERMLRRWYNIAVYTNNIIYRLPERSRGYTAATRPLQSERLFDVCGRIVPQADFRPVEHGLPVSLVPGFYISRSGTKPAVRVSR
jgi:rhodanese-related sulfurtransferase